MRQRAADDELVRKIDTRSETDGGRARLGGACPDDTAAEMPEHEHPSGARSGSTDQDMPVEVKFPTAFDDSQEAIGVPADEL